ncbi:hypothetical protein [Streptacidiphilus fuscans]|uniref:Uncharacterized protein n=1 Tax=Streptacidiphilus fuscans TaxID=2789292 RepID=A0A931B361_9ACTN|nr:hypothetical protein [Streptacidiphilus fuscans]MBF9069401.1 hypothetical protein [Streptacidiphilus fuscans]
MFSTEELASQKAGLLPGREALGVLRFDCGGSAHPCSMIPTHHRGDCPTTGHGDTHHNGTWDRGHQGGDRHCDPRSEHGHGGDHRGDHRGDHQGDRGGDHRGGDHRGDRGGDRGDHRGGDRGGRC